ncbi:MAG: transglycosylase SLT domain-containing protein [Comamonas sp.]|nr:transglycosylase SLT domain-containing protein [Comamonas sp.]
MRPPCMPTLRLFLVLFSLWLAGCAATVPPGPQASGPLKPLSQSSLASGKVASLEPPQDLWERIRSGFAMPNLESDKVTDREQWYSSRPDYILRMTERSKKYLFHIVEELEKRNMPTELALLPYIESAFNPQAVSSAKAAGMWQFMPATGTYFDLQQNMLRDDRRDVLASTRAALDYLEKLHAMFGDWHLALAAYNWGEGSVSRAIKRNEKAQLGTSYTDLTMPAETQFYVPKLQAVKNIIANPEAFGTELPVIENHPFFDVVEIQHDMDAQVAAELADVSMDDFKALNPSLKKPVIFAAATQKILLPWDNAKVFKQNLQELKSGKNPKLASWTVWKAPTTMRLADVMAQTGASEAQLREVNDIPPRMMIKAGSALIVPRLEPHTQDVPQQLANNARLEFTPEYSLVTKRKAIRVQRGDTLASLAKRHNVSAHQLTSWNKLPANAGLRIGQTLSIYTEVQQAIRSQASGKRTTANNKKAAPAKRVAQAAPQKRGGTPAKRKR